MGRLTSGEYNIYGRGSEQIDLAKQNRINNPNGNQTTLGTLGALYLPQLLAFGVDKIVNHSNNKTEGTSNSSSSNANVPTLTSAEVADILKKYDVNATDDVDPNYSDVEIALEQKQKELSELETQYKAEVEAYETAKSNYEKASAQKEEFEAQVTEKSADLESVNSEIETKSARLNAIPAEITQIDSQISNLLNSDDAGTQSVQTAIADLKAKKADLQQEQESLRNELGLDANGKQIQGAGLYGEQAALTEEINNLNNEIQKLGVESLKSTMEAAETQNVKTVIEYRTLVADIEQDLQKLDTYYGKESISSQKNEETESIVKLLKEYNNEDDPAKKASIEKEIKGAITVYKNKHPNGGNPTVDKFIRMFEQKLTSGSSSSSL